MPLQCTECSREFSVKSNLTRHLRMVHNVEVERIDILPADFNVYHYKCLEGCNISFKYNRELRKHLSIKHQMHMVELSLEFPNSEEFHKWLQNEEVSNYVQYVHLTATKRKSTGMETYYYECNRTGKPNHVDDNARKRKARKWITKLNHGCTSQIIVHKSHDDSFSINYYKTHYGHKISLEHVKLSKHDRGAIASKLLLGLPIATVLHSAKTTDGALKRINLVGRKDIFNIRRSFNIALRDGKLVSVDAVNVKSFLVECSLHQHNPILYCNIQDVPESDDICFIIMSKYQAEVLKESCNNIVVISSTLLNHCNFELVTLFVVSQSWESFPAACMFTNKMQRKVYELFFDKIKERLGTLAPAIIVTNCSEMYYGAWKNVMGEVSYSIYNQEQVDLDWKANLNKIVCSETDVTKIKRKWVFDNIKMLQKNKDENDFLENLEATLKVLGDDRDFGEFLDYFLKHYSEPKRWADCYRIGVDVPVQQLKVINDVLKQYLNEDSEIRFDKIFHSLIRFIRDESVNSMLKTKTNRIYFVNENDSRHTLLMDKQLNGTHMGEDLWNVGDVERGTTYVVQKYLKLKCCNLTCTSCHICIHCFSCTCVDFFISNAICVHIHYIWMTYFQSIVQSDECYDGEQNCDEEIIIEIEHEIEKNIDDSVQLLRDAIVDRTSILADNIGNVQSESTLKVILDTITKLCEVSGIDDQSAMPEDNASDHQFLDDHCYL